jgi:Flp pilus assembly secretin CpaC
MQAVLRWTIAAVFAAGPSAVPGSVLADEASPALRPAPKATAASARRIAEAEMVRGRTEIIKVVLDLARILRLNEPARTIVIGNPAVLDATINDERTLVLTGKTLGTTNMIVLDGKGNEVANLMVNVVQGSHVVTVHRGNQKEIYNCVGGCTPAVALGTGGTATPDATTTGSIQRRQ